VTSLLISLGTFEAREKLQKKAKKHKKAKNPLPLHLVKAFMRVMCVKNSEDVKCQFRNLKLEALLPLT
jgi:hypothetical protein